MRIFDHWGKPKPFSSECLSLKTKKSRANAAISELSQRNKEPSFQNLTSHFSNAVTLSPISGVSSCFYLNHINK